MCWIFATSYVHVHVHWLRARPNSTYVDTKKITACCPHGITGKHEKKRQPRSQGNLLMHSRKPDEKGQLGKVCRWRCKSRKGQSEQSPPETEKLRWLDVIYDRIAAFLAANLLLVPPAPAKCVRARSLCAERKEINQSNGRFSSILAASWRAVECLTVRG